MICSPNGSYIASSDDSGAVCVWGQNKTLLKIIRCHDESVQMVAFSSDSKIFLTACSLGNVRLFLTPDVINSKKLINVKIIFLE